MMDLSIKAVDVESQIFKKNLKFKFQAVKQQILQRFPPNAVRILFSVIFNHFVRKIRTLGIFEKMEPFFVLIFFKHVCHDFSVRYSGRL